MARYRGAVTVGLALAVTVVASGVSAGQDPSPQTAFLKQYCVSCHNSRLKDAPGFDKDAWPRMADQNWATQIHSYYKAKPYWE